MRLLLHHILLLLLRTWLWLLRSWLLLLLLGSLSLLQLLLRIRGRLGGHLTIS